MIKLNKYEVGGIAVSIGCLALALFLLRLDGTLDGVFAGNNTTDSQPANVMTAVSLGELSSTLEGAMVGDTVNNLVATDVTIGNGKEVQDGDTVTVNYIGTLQNGQEFDNSYKKGESFSFKVGAGKVILGWEEGVIGMKEGGQRILIVPADKAYGSKGYGPIPGNATLVFAIELIEVK